MSTRFTCALSLMAALSLPGAVHAQTFVPIAIGTEGAPRGYWEFLPSAYADEPARELPIVIFFHGLGEGGNGASELSRVLVAGPPRILDTASHPLHDLFEDRDVIVLAPQLTSGTWWGSGHVRPFLTYALAHYRVDLDRVYLTGLSAGAHGVQDFMNRDAGADAISAALVVAVRGAIEPGEGDYLAGSVPFWALTAIGDASSNATGAVDALAGFLLGTAPTDVMSGYPGSAETRTATFSVATGWVWEDGVVGRSGVSPKLTLYPGSSHDSWTRTYDSMVVWDWLLAQRKGGGGVIPDAGPGELDAGTPSDDAGASDAGTSPTDAGVAALDAGVASEDASTRILDAGAPPVDPPLDPPVDPGGCSCAAAGAPARRAPAILLLGLAILRTARRRRARRSRAPSEAEPSRLARPE